MIAMITFFGVVLAIHVAAVMISFGTVFAYPIMAIYVHKLEPGSVPTFHRMQAFLDRRLVSPGMVLILAAGIYLASKTGSFGAFYVQWGFGAIIVIGGLAGAYFPPHYLRQAELAQRDIDTSSTGKPAFSAEYKALSRQVAGVGAVTAALILLTIYFMVAHTGG